MYSRSLPLLVSFLSCCFVVSGQLVNVRTCSAGLQADGSLDWSKLPVQSALGLNATIPITGVPGLTVNVQIPAVTSPALANATFNVNSPIDLAVANPASVTLTFNHPVKGVSASIGTDGRFARTVSMIADYGGSNLPSQAQVDADNADLASVGDLDTVPLQIRSESVNINNIVIQFPGVPDEYFVYDILNIRIESGAGPDISKQVPLKGLKQWLRADSIYDPSFYAPPVPVWKDQSGNHADATGPGGVSPALADGPNCTPVVNFGGGGLTANLPINGWTGMSVFLVSKSVYDVGGWWENQPIFWPETELWGTTFISPSQSNVFFRFGTTQVNNQPVYARPINVFGDYTLTTAIHDASVDRMYLNGLLALEQEGKQAAISGVSSTEQIGSGLNNTFFVGAIGEILIYDRALNDTEREVVEHYLMKKFGLF